MKKRILTLVLFVLCFSTFHIQVFADTEDHGLPLPIGDENPASSWLFTGQSYLLNLVQHDEVWNAENMMNVTFEPCCRTDWHSHAGGQILIAVGGIGIHQVEGQEPEVLLPGTVARVAPGVMHWHGAADTGWFQHIAIETNPEQTGFSMGEKVDDEYYSTVLDKVMDSINAK